MAGRPSLVSAARPPRVRSSAGRQLLVALAGLALLGVCGLVARNGRVGAIERGAFRAVNDLPDWLYRFLWVFQQFGNLVIALVVAVVIALPFVAPRSLAAGAAVGLKLVLERAVKQVVERQRPGTSIGSAIHARGDVSLQGLSFVSGHSVIVTAMAGLLTPILPRRWKPGAMGHRRAQWRDARLRRGPQPPRCRRRLRARPRHRRRPERSHLSHPTHGAC